MTPDCYYDKTLITLFDDAIEDGCKSYNELTELQKERATIICLSIMGNDAYQYVTDSGNFEKVIDSLMSFIDHGDSDHALDLANVMKDNAIAHAEVVLSDLFNERLDQNFVDRQVDAGLRPITDETNGEVLWVR